jgi:hypothetical protein
MFALLVIMVVDFLTLDYMVVVRHLQEIKSIVEIMGLQFGKKYDDETVNLIPPSSPNVVLSEPTVSLYTFSSASLFLRRPSLILTRVTHSHRLGDCGTARS